jgi:hypothetical protein
MPRLRVPRRWMVFAAPVVSLLLIGSYPSRGNAVPTVTSGSLGMGYDGGISFGGGDLTLSDNTTIQFFYASPFGSADSGGAAIDWGQIDNLDTTVVYAGQTFPSCGSTPRGPQCAFMDSVSLRMFVPHTPDPQSPGGPLSVTVPGTFSVFGLGVELWDNTTGPLRVIGSVGFGFPDPVEGPASLTFHWCPECCPECSVVPPCIAARTCDGVPAPPQVGAWLFSSGFGQIEPTPEPTTLLLWATGAAGLGVVRWRTRRLRCAP